MRHIKLIVLLFLISFALAGCDTDSDLDRRLDQTSLNVEVGYITGLGLEDAAWRGAKEDVLRAIEVARGDQLIEPRIASIVLAEDSDGEYQAFVYWLQDKPTLESVALEADDGRVVSLDIAGDSSQGIREADAAQLALYLSILPVEEAVSEDGNWIVTQVDGHAPEQPVHARITPQGPQSSTRQALGAIETK